MKNEAIKTYLLGNLYTVKNPGDATTPVRDITPTYEQEEKAFGSYGADQGELAVLFPEVFGEEVVRAAHPNTSPSYARGIIALQYLDDDTLHYYSEEKHNFFESEAFREAQSAGKQYLIMENLS